MPKVTALAPASESHFMDCREKVADAHATRGEPSFYDYAPAMNAANLLDLILIHRRELPFVLDPWTL